MNHTREDKGPRIVYVAPLLWLDHQELLTKRWLMQQMPGRVVAFENAISVLEFALTNLQRPPPVHTLTFDDLLDQRDPGALRDNVFRANVALALDALCAGRLLLLHGYFSRLVSSMRTSLEALTTADICRNDGTKARSWVRGNEVRKRGRVRLHSALEDMWTHYGFYSQAGVHPQLSQLAMAHLSHARTYEAVSTEDQWNTTKQALESFLDDVNDFAARFLLYVDETCAVDWQSDPDMATRKDLVLSKEPTASADYPYVQRPAVLTDTSDLGRPDAEVLSRLRELFHEPPVFMERLGDGARRAFEVFLETAVDEFKASFQQGLSEGSLRTVRGTEPDQAAVESTMIAGAFVVGFEMGDEYAVRWGSLNRLRPPENATNAG